MAASPYDANALAPIVTEVYEEAEERLIRMIAKYTAQGIDSPDWLNDLLTRASEVRREAEEIVKALEKSSSRAYRKALTEAYRRGRRFALDELGVKNGVFNPNASAINALMLDAAGVQKRLGIRIMSSAPQGIAKIGQSVALQLTTGTVTRKQAAALALEKFAKEGITGMVDRGGRKWDMVTYAEMSTRTLASKSLLTGHVEQMQDLGKDLVIVSDVREECEKCRPYEGKILSTSGRTRPGKYKDEDGGTYTVVGSLRSATSDGFQHPNCRHTISIFLPGISEAPKHVTSDPEGAKLRGQQRQMERDVRKQKIAVLAVKELNDPAELKRANAKLREKQSALKSFNTENDRQQGKGRTSLSVR